MIVDLIHRLWQRISPVPALRLPPARTPTRTPALALYTHIPPGTYTFKVIASNNDGAWNEKGALLNLYLNPAQIEHARAMLKDRRAALNNWIATAVETGTNPYGTQGKTGFEAAQELVRELRKNEELDATLRLAQTIN